MRPLPCLATFVAWCLVNVSSADAQISLRWKLAANDEFVVHTEQKTESNVAFGGKSATTKIEMQLDIRWKVLRASDASFVVRQSVERLTARLIAAAGSAEFDSAAKGRPVGLAKQLSDSLQPILGAEIETELNARGELLSAKPANPAAEVLFRADATNAGAGARSAVHQVLSQSILQLPANEVEEGDHWQAARELATPAGPLRQETTYEFKKFLDRDGDRLCQIEFKSTLAMQEMANATGNASPAAIKIQDHEQQGTILFSPEGGRVVESEQKQKLITNRSYRDTAITVTLESTQKTTIQ